VCSSDLNAPDGRTAQLGEHQPRYHCSAFPSVWLKN
jgi:hypothetical protein